MSNLSININLASLKCVVKPLTGKSGEIQDCMIIPIKANNLIIGKGGIYLDLVAFPLKENKIDSNDTHCIKQSFTKEYLKDLPEEEKSALPFFGNVVDWDKVLKVNKHSDLDTTLHPDELENIEAF